MGFIHVSRDRGVEEVVEYWHEAKPSLVVTEICPVRTFLACLIDGWTGGGKDPDPGCGRGREAAG